ncbi:hypothetical protein TorRG33x02_328140 [Trema orientale]|uniref:Uncharacterized protein n=1 Tax=Trema orientale TaxID=63057 RepID=A0A2P5BAD7_TREOI|nr:hypothetical protein TorRG33x02_328140 [Trema orientale]
MLVSSRPRGRASTITWGKNQNGRTRLVIGSGSARRGKLRHRHPLIDLKIRLLESEESAIDVPKRDKTIALALPSGLVKDYDGLLELAVSREEGVEALGGGVLPESPNEELLLGDITIERRRAHRVIGNSFLGDIEELV